jgi:hypothetical protein
MCGLKNFHWDDTFLKRGEKVVVVVAHEEELP